MTGSSVQQLVEIVRNLGVCPREDACESPNPASSDCLGCIASWKALDEILEAVAEGTS